MDAAARITREELLWALGSLCTLHRIAFDADLVLSQTPPPYNLLTLIHAVRALNFKALETRISARAIQRLVLPCLAVLDSDTDNNGDKAVPMAVAPAATGRETDKNNTVRLALVVKADTDRVLYFEAGSQTPSILPVADFAARFTGRVVLFAREAGAPSDPDAATQGAHVPPSSVAGAPGAATRAANGKTGSAVQTGSFGFRWFIPELLKHKSVWRDVLLASLVMQLMALATPLFTQVIIDKVVVHRTLSTLTVIGIALLVFMLFTAAMSWVRQYLVLHTGNRVDAVLGMQVWEHLIQLPPRYFEQRPTGVVVARLQAVETIREFIAGAAVTLILDIPFLAIFLVVMFHYSVPLSLISVTVLGAIVLLSLIVSPWLRARLNQQFLLGARNQAFLTEYVAGIETVKSLQMEPQLKQRYGDLLASYLASGFKTRQLANTYNTGANALEQLLTLLILWYGAYLVMTRTDFSIGMLVAFQMFASRLSQPLLRLVGLWQQFQQAHIAVQRLGDVMNAPAEPYSLIPMREAAGTGHIELRQVAFRYGKHLPWLYRDLNLQLKPGHCVALIGPSGSGKSTLAKLLQGFYPSSDGQILIDGRDVRHLSANELRQSLGVVPQDTVLFSGSVYDNLLLANPHASFEQIVAVCRMAEIHHVIEQLPQGYQTEIGERGAGLSGGQKQRLAIARALLKGPKVLIFDEATSSLDTATAEQLAKTINKLKGEVTVLFIAHQIPKGLHLDEVVRLGGDPAREEQHISIITSGPASAAEAVSTPSPRSRAEGRGQYDPPLAPSGERGGGEGRFSDNSHQTP